jgi:hypothetical protein
MVLVTLVLLIDFDLILANDFSLSWDFVELVMEKAF